MDLLKAFVCIPHDLLIAKLHAYEFSFERLTLLCSYLRNGKQCVKINNICSDFLKILPGVPQGSILGPILFNMFLNDLFLWLKKADLHNFADGNSITAGLWSISWPKKDFGGWSRTLSGLVQGKWNGGKFR